ncbi:testis-expressed protein 11-like [Gigantopelta aegis]|uniref:testis-expressed protein 11-like n=1 Tax=Gigantopelta aegis TaxID=1735272 RepID=UPI001B88928F|nr:testis-expressed protein 11-like [Gigantopelta aegis]
METTPSNSSCHIDQLQGIINELCRDGSHQTGDWQGLLEKASSLIIDLQNVGLGMLNKTNCIKLENMAVTLWNYAVAMKTKGALSKLSNAKLRNVAFLMVTYANDGSVDEINLKKQIIMGMKTGRAWIDCCQPEAADRVLTITNKCAQHLHGIVVDRKNQSGGTDGIDGEKLSIEKDMFKLLCYKAEVAVAQSKNMEALTAVQIAEEMMERFPKEGAFLSMLCYNFGVDTFNRRQYEESISWLRKSFDLGKGRQDVGAKNHARTLRLLANAYLEWNPTQNLDKALNAVTLANTEHLHPAGLFLKLKILLATGERGSAIHSGLDEVIRHADTSIDLGLSVLQLLKEHNGYESAGDFPSKLVQRFEKSPDLGRILVFQLETLLQCHNLNGAKQFAEECITAHNTGKPLDATTKKLFHVAFWEQAALCFEHKEYSEALEWYNYSLSLFSPSESLSMNMAKLQRNRASCYLQQQLIPQAKEAIEEALKCDTSAAHTHYIIYKLALMESDGQKAISSLEKMLSGIKNVECFDKSSNYGLICLAAQLALEQNSNSTACIALEYLVNHSTNSQQVLTALRCLVRLRIGAVDSGDAQENSMAMIIPHVRTAYNKLLVICDTEESSQIRVQEEATWFMKIAWNLAVKCEDDPFCMKEFFTLCFQLLSLSPSDTSSASRQQTCTLMSAAGCLQIARQTNEEVHKKEAFEEVLHHIQNYRSLVHSGESRIWTVNQKPDTSDILLLLYEFEACVKLNDSCAENILEKALTMPQPEPKMFESLAALAIEPPADNKSLCVRALKVAIRTHLQKETPDFQRCSKDIHSLIQLSLSGVGNREFLNKEETLSYFKETVEIIANKAMGQFPEIEILWLMTKAWNCGIQFYSSANYDEAEKWCGLSMSMLKYLPTMRSNYEEQMNSVYSQVLSGIDKSKGQRSLEE